MIEDSIIDRIINSNKIIVVYGPRQVGKTTLVNNIISKLGLKTLKINADEMKYSSILSSKDLDKMKSLFEGYSLVFIDEAQKVPDIGVNLKIIKDGKPDLKVIVTGSSSFELANKIKEPLTGRVWTYTLYPLSLKELKAEFNSFELEQKLNNLLVFGSYPEVFTTVNMADKQKLLLELAESYIYKDILTLEVLRHSNKLHDLLKLLSYQVGSEVSLNELSNNLGINRETVERYLYLLEKAFVIFRMSGFSRNLRKEVSKMDKIYFYDLGIRNAVIDNLKDIADRNDAGQLWENFLMIERKKKLDYEEVPYSSYFWRLYTGAELDYIEERNGDLHGYEFKYNRNKTYKIPKAWKETYPDSEYQLINPANYLEFVT